MKEKSQKKKGAGAPESADLSTQLLKHAAIGLESEFTFVLNEEEVNPRDIFKDPRGFIRGDLMHRQGSSFHIHTGGIVYFDNGVIELATPLIEIASGCAARAGRSLWESIRFVRQELDAWEKLTGNSVRLSAYSTHYNVSFDVAASEQGLKRTVKKLALLLTYILPMPVMLLASNPRSLGIGARPRGDRIEITSDFTPSASLMIATATLITGIIREVITWDSYELDVLREKRIPRIKGFKPVPHTTRKGWLARPFCFPHDPYRVDLDAEVWEISDTAGAMNGGTQRHLSTRQIAQRIFSRFVRSIARISDPFTLRLISSIINGISPSLLQLPDRPKSYENVGTLCTWENIFPERLLSRSRYERVLIRAISGKRLWIDGYSYTPVGMKGWTRVIFRRDVDRTTHILSIDFLLSHLDDWEKT